MNNASAAGKLRNALASGLLILLATGCGAAADEVGETRAVRRTPVAAMEITQRDLSRQLTTSATVEPKAQIRLASRISGTMDEVLFEEGEAVTQGQLLARMDMAEQQAEFARARAEEEQARVEYGRGAELRSAAMISASDYDHLRMQLRVAESTMQLWETRVAFGEIRAPRDAVITQRFVEPGEAVDSHQTLFELTVMDELVLRLGISELDVVHLHHGQAVPVLLDAIPGEELAGVVRRIFPVADRSSRLITVEVALPSDASERGVRAGLSGAGSHADR